MESAGFRPQNRLFNLPSPPGSFQLEVHGLLLGALCIAGKMFTSVAGKDQTFHLRSTQDSVWKTPADKGSPRRYENSTSERAIHYVFFKDPGRGGGRKAANMARSSWDRGRPLAPAYQLPKTHIQLESHKSCSKDYPSGRAMLSGLDSAHAKTLLCQNNFYFSSFDLDHVQSILRQGCFHLTQEQHEPSGAKIPTS